MAKRVLLVAGILVALIAPLGCTGAGEDLRPDPYAGKTTAQRAAATIDAIKNNPNMNDRQKQAAISAIQSGHH